MISNKLDSRQSQDVNTQVARMMLNSKPEPELQERHKKLVNAGGIVGAFAAGLTKRLDDMGHENAVIEALGKIGDTTCDSDIGEYLVITKSLGFKIAYMIEFPGMPESVPEALKTEPRCMKDRLYVLGNEKTGVVMSVETHTWPGINGMPDDAYVAKVKYYYAWTPTTVGHYHRYTSIGGWKSPSVRNWEMQKGKPADLFWFGHHDKKEGIKIRLGDLAHYGIFHAVWPKLCCEPFGLFMTSKDWENALLNNEVGGVSRIKARDALILQGCPDWFKTIINGNLG